jgi:hypothetical protein
MKIVLLTNVNLRRPVSAKNRKRRTRLKVALALVGATLIILAAIDAVIGIM